MKGNNIYNPPSFSVIEAAVKGDTTAINAILKHYDRYIASLSQRPYFDVNGGLHMIVQPDVKHRLESKLITRILRFQVI